MKQLEKMSLANVKNKLTRKEMSNIMAGSGFGFATCRNGESCWLYIRQGGIGVQHGTCANIALGRGSTSDCRCQVGGYQSSSTGTACYQ